MPHIPWMCCSTSPSKTKLMPEYHAGQGTRAHVWSFEYPELVAEWRKATKQLAFHVPHRWRLSGLGI